MIMIMLILSFFLLTTLSYQHLFSLILFPLACSEYVEDLLRKIKFFSFRIEKIEGKFKMSQNRTLRDQLSVIEQLKKGSPEDHAVAGFMEKHNQLTE